MSEKPRFCLNTVPGYFLQDDPATDANSFDYVSTNFGLITRHYSKDVGIGQKCTQWERFERHLERLNASHKTAKFKVLFLGRHGQGVHNVAQSYYGTKNWDAYWSLQDGDERGKWADARLTQKGIEQAKVANKAWAEQLLEGIPSPQSFYVSPLNRCLATARITFEDLPMAGTSPFRPIIKELLRETLGEHTCDRRSTATEIAAEYPLYRFEEGFKEEDTLWDPRIRESNEQRNLRLHSLLDDIFATDDNTYISLTAHNGAIMSILEVLGHRQFALMTGAVIPVLVRAEKLDVVEVPLSTDDEISADLSAADTVARKIIARATKNKKIKALFDVVQSGKATPAQNTLWELLIAKEFDMDDERWEAEYDNFFKHQENLPALSDEYNASYAGLDKKLEEEKM